MLRGINGTGGGVPVGGSGTANTIAVWTGTGSTLGNSGVTDNGTTVSFVGRNLASTAAQTWTLTTSLNISSNLLFLDATNARVGVGTATPNAQFHIARAGGLSASAEYLRLQNSSVGSGSNVTQTFFVHGNTVATGNVSHTWSGTTYDTLFSVWNNSLSSIQEAMRIQGGGNVGIGTASPVAGGLTIYGASNAQVFVQNSSGYTRLLQNSTDFYIDGNVSGSAGSIIFRRASSTLESARIDSSGNIYGTSGTTGMTNGFFYIPAAAGTPTGTPTAVSGRVPMYYDTTNNKFYVYNVAWKAVTLA